MQNQGGILSYIGGLLKNTLLMLVRRIISTAVRIDSLPSEDRQCQKPMGGSSGGEQEPLWGVVVVTWHHGHLSAVSDDVFSCLEQLNR